MRRAARRRGASGPRGVPAAVGAAVALLLKMGLAAVPVTAATHTYASAPAAVIPDALPPGPGTPRSVSNSIEVPDHGVVTDLDVTVTLRHPGHGDLSLDLAGPDGSVAVRLIATEGGPGDGLYDVTFDDEASGLPPGFVVNGTCLVGQTYRPAPDALSAFDGLDVHGSWTLTVTDHFVSDAADCDCDGSVLGPTCPRTLDAWSLTVTLADDDEPTLTCREILVLLGVILLLLAILWLLVTRTRP